MPRKFRLLILGAGFSRPAGLPLADSLWREIRSIATTFNPESRAGKFNDDISEYLEFLRDTEGTSIAIEEVDFERFMRFLDIEHFLGLRGGDTWSRDGNESTVVTKFLIGKILARHVNSIHTIPDLYLEFARHAEPDDIIITFNYDTLLERAFDAVGKPYRLFQTRYSEFSNFGGTLDQSLDEVVLLKVHGSIDWFDKTEYDNMVRIFESHGAPLPTDVIFSNARALDLVKIVDGPCPPNHPLKDVFRARNLAALYEMNLLFNATPRMLAPSSAKILYANQLNDFWEGIGRAGYLNFGMAIIGFSLPDQDEYAKQILYSLVTNYQRGGWDDEQFGLRKSPLAIVDYFGDPTDVERFKSNEANFKSRYRFVDWSKANIVGTGFDISSIEHIFS